MIAYPILTAVVILALIQYAKLLNLPVFPPVKPVLEVPPAVPVVVKN